MPLFFPAPAIARGIIGAWYSTIATIPSGWLFCNGANGTPDYRNAVLAGAQEDQGGVAKTNISGALTQSGGAATHNHTFTGTAHSHTHTATHTHVCAWSNIGSHSHAFGVPNHTHTVQSTSNTQAAYGTDFFPVDGVGIAESGGEYNGATGEGVISVNENTGAAAPGATDAATATGTIDTVAHLPPYAAAVWIMKS